MVPGSEPSSRRLWKLAGKGRKRPRLASRQRLRGGRGVADHGVPRAAGHHGEPAIASRARSRSPAMVSSSEPMANGTRRSASRERTRREPRSYEPKIRAARARIHGRNDAEPNAAVLATQKRTERTKSEPLKIEPSLDDHESPCVGAQTRMCQGPSQSLDPGPRTRVFKQE